MSQPQLPPAVARHTDIRSLRDSKEPRSAVEMAAIVAFYLNEIAPEGERRQAIGTADLDKYFKQAGFKLPKAQNMTLVNALSAGYFDRVGQGQYRLNPVGYNLVVHNLPARTGDAGGGTRAKKRTSSTKKTVASKKASIPRKAVAKKARAAKPAAKKPVATPSKAPALTKPSGR